MPGYSRHLSALSVELDVPLETHIRQYLYEQLSNNPDQVGMEAPLEECPEIDPNMKVNIYHVATNIYHAPSDATTIGGMHREMIRANPHWRKMQPRHDCVLVEGDPLEKGFRGLEVAQVVCFLSFRHDGDHHQGALVHWFQHVGDRPCDATGMWQVKPQCWPQSRRRMTSIIHIDSIFRSVHLLPIFGRQNVPRDLHHSETLAAYRMFYVNRYIDYQTHETVY